MKLEEKKMIDKMNREELSALWKEIQGGHVILSYEGEIYLKKRYKEKPQTRELWTAIKKDDEMICFEVEDMQTEIKRQEKININALPLMFALGGLPVIGYLLKIRNLPWSFKKIGDNIHMDD